MISNLLLSRHGPVTTTLLCKTSPAGSHPRRSRKAIDALPVWNLRRRRRGAKKFSLLVVHRKRSKKREIFSRSQGLFFSSAVSRRKPLNWGPERMPGAPGVKKSSKCEVPEWADAATHSTCMQLCRVRGYRWHSALNLGHIGRHRRHSAAATGRPAASSDPLEGLDAHRMGRRRVSLQMFDVYRCCGIYRPGSSDR